VITMRPRSVWRARLEHGGVRLVPLRAGDRQIQPHDAGASIQEFAMLLPSPIQA